MGNIIGEQEFGLEHVWIVRFFPFCLNVLLHASKSQWFQTKLHTGTKPNSLCQMALVHVIDSVEHSSESSYRKLCHRKYINVVWHYV